MPPITELATQGKASEIAFTGLIKVACAAIPAKSAALLLPVAARTVA